MSEATQEKIDLLRKILGVVTAQRDNSKDFTLRIQRGDPRVCKPEHSNPRYFEKFGHD